MTISQPPTAFEKEFCTPFTQHLWQFSVVCTHTLQWNSAEHQCHYCSQPNSLYLYVCHQQNPAGGNNSTRLFISTGAIPTSDHGSSFFMDVLCVSTTLSKILTAPWANKLWTFVNPQEDFTSGVSAFHSCQPTRPISRRLKSCYTRYFHLP